MSQRVMIFGLPGSGKSTFAVKLAERLELPLDHLDRHFYIENWVERDYEEFLAIQKELIAKDTWVIDGNAMRSLEMRYQRADTAIYFCLPVRVCLWRMIKRIFHQNWQIPDLAEGCTKSASFRLLRYMFGFKKRYASKIQQLQEKYPQVAFYLVQSDKEANQLLEGLS